MFRNLTGSGHLIDNVVIIELYKSFQTCTNHNCVFVNTYLLFISKRLNFKKYELFVEKYFVNLMKEFRIKYIF